MPRHDIPGPEEREMLARLRAELDRAGIAVEDRPRARAPRPAEPPLEPGLELPPREAAQVRRSLAIGALGFLLMMLLVWAVTTR